MISIIFSINTIDFNFTIDQDIPLKNHTYIPPHFLINYGADGKQITEVYEQFKKIPDKYGEVSKTIFLKAINDPINVTAIETLSKGHYPPAMNLMGQFYYYGIYPYQQNFTAAYYLFKRSASIGEVESYNYLAQMYHQ